MYHFQGLWFLSTLDQASDSFVSGCRNLALKCQNLEAFMVALADWMAGHINRQLISTPMPKIFFCAFDHCHTFYSEFERVSEHTSDCCLQFSCSVQLVSSSLILSVSSSLLACFSSLTRSSSIDFWERPICEFKVYVYFWQLSSALAAQSKLSACTWIVEAELLADVEPLNSLLSTLLHNIWHCFDLSLPWLVNSG